jgi:hypothetical protein
VAILAERLLSPATLAAMRAVLAASPIDPAIKPFCPPVVDDPIATAATWADDERTLDPSTAGWHFIDFPLVLGAEVGDYRRYCPHGNCIVEAIVMQFRTLTTTQNPIVKGNALRYLIHFIGDLHQPLHTTTNGDRGGNCFPVTYYAQPPKPDQFRNVRPNLHAVWDERTIDRIMAIRGLRSVAELADFIASDRALHQLQPRAPTRGLVVSWAKGANLLARTVTYGRLPVPVPLEPAETYSLADCDHNHHVKSRMAALDERIDAAYEKASGPVILSQLRLAGERLAATVNAAFSDIERR